MIKRTSQLPWLISAIFSFMLLNCASPKKMTVIIKMMPAQEEHFRKKVIPPFEKKHNVKVDVQTMENVNDLPKLIKEADEADGLHLVKVPFEMTRVLTGQNLILPIDSILPPEGIQGLKSEYFLMDLVKLNKHYFYMPRKFETRTLLYLKSYVREAVNNWETLRDEINMVLKRHNKYGLPKDFRLEKDPAEWDYFDIFVVGFYWKSKEISGAKMPRIAHRAKRYPGTALRMMDRAYQLGASPSDILRFNGEPMIDMLMWEALYTQEQIYNPKMYQEEWSGGDIWKGFRSGDVFLSFMTQIDAFFVHGAGTEAMPGFISNPEDMGVAIMPKGVSLLIDQDGAPLREGSRSITTGGWWWGIPRNTPDRQLSFELAHYITNTENQIEGCSGFGMVPVRQDMLSELGLMFGGGWISEVFHVASQQLVENKFTVIPLVDEYSDIGKNYIDAFYDICIGGNTGPDGIIDYNHIQKVLSDKYIPKQKNILQKKYPPPRSSARSHPTINQKFKALNKDLE
ncbi:MAG: extracellular solute-binding protein [Fibrobacteria bacterium]|nr:extracellular solute-binding protein [Fibrobacteria bacterium]